MSFQQELQRNQKEWYTQGKEETQIKFVKDMFTEGLSIERIAKIAHLTVEQVEEILSSNSEDSDINQSN